jgi:hypothetical protein
VQHGQIGPRGHQIAGALNLIFFGDIEAEDRRADLVVGDLVECGQDAPAIDQALDSNF